MRNAIMENPSIASQRIMSWQFVNKDGRTLVKDDPLNFKPRIAFNCENTTVIAAAEQKPAITGPDMNSIKNPAEEINFIILVQFEYCVVVKNKPKLSKPAMSSKHPERKLKTITYSGP